MKDLFLEAIDELALGLAAEGYADHGFNVDSDQKAGWVMEKIRGHEEDCQRICDGCDVEIARLTAVKEAAQEKCEQQTSNLKYMLREYMKTVKVRCTKTQESYTMAAGKLIVKHKADKVDRDDKVLLSWMKENAPEYITEKVSYSPAWATLKDTLTVSGSEYMTKEGLIVEGVRLVPQEDEFIIQFTEVHG